MFKASMYSLRLVSYLAIALVLLLPAGIVVGQEGPFGGIKEKMANISETERDNLENLFAISQQIQDIEKEERIITRDIKTKNVEIEDLQVKIAGEEVAYTQTLEDLKQVLKSYQRMGPGTYLEIILNSDSLPMLLRRINTLRDLTRNTGKLTDLLEESKAKQLAQKTNLAEKISVLESSQRQLRESLTAKKQLIDDQENYLASLKDKRESYQENLANLQQNWEELKTLVPSIIRELSSLIDQGNLPADKVKISYSLTNFKGSIDDTTLNEIVSTHPLLPKISFNFYSNNVELRMPDKNLVLSGIFVIQGEHTIRFQVNSGSFYEIPLDAGAIEDLFIKGDLAFKLKLPISSYTITSIKTTEGYLEMTIDFKIEEAGE